MNTETASCKICGQPLNSNGRCPRCGAVEHVWTLRDWRFLLQLALLIVFGFSFTRLVVNANSERRQHLASRYYAQGVRQLERQHPAEAVQALENALIYARENFEYQLKLTDALLASGQTSEALAQLHGLLVQRPGDAEVYLKLARLEAQRNQAEAAEKYYQAAIQGSWPAASDAFRRRIEARLEAAEYLLDQGRRQKAEVELVALSEILPAAWPERIRLGNLFLRNGDPVRARNVYAALLTQDESNPAALMGAGRAAIATGDFAGAQRYLKGLSQSTQDSRTLLARLERMEKLDPFAPHTTARQRAVRTIAIFHLATDRMARCGVPIPSQAPYSIAEGSETAAGNSAGLVWSGEWIELRDWAAQLAPLMEESKLLGHDQLIESALRFALQAELQAKKSCGRGTLDDEALLLMAQGRMGAEQ
jgi:thioredoxin-like negative regulator of GroEL